MGDSSYPDFCGFGKYLDASFNTLDGSRLVTLGFGDELGDRDSEFKKWSQLAFSQAALECNLDLGQEINRHPELSKIVTKWVPADSKSISEGRQLSTSKW